MRGTLLGRGRNSVVEYRTFNARVVGSTPTALITVRNPSPNVYSSLACFQLVVTSDSRVMYLHDLQVQGIPSLYQDNRRRNNQSVLDSLFFHDSFFLLLYDSTNWKI